MKTLELKEGFLNRHIVGLPKEICNIEIIYKDTFETEVVLCEWKPFNPNNYKPENMPAKGYLGTCIEISGKFIGIGHHAWEQNDSEFIYYKIIYK